MKKPMLALCALALTATLAHASETTTWGTLKSQTAPSPIAAKAVAGADVSDVFDFHDINNIIRKNGSILKRQTDGVSLNLKTTDLPEGEAITLWWVVFNVPEACVDGCGEDDLGNPDVQAAVFHATGAVANANGQVPFKADLPEGPPAGEAPFGLPGDAIGLGDAATAEIHLVVRTHGPAAADAAELEEQLTTYAGGCTPESSFGIGDGENTCVDLQAAIHFP